MGVDDLGLVSPPASLHVPSRGVNGFFAGAGGGARARRSIQFGVAFDGLLGHWAVWTKRAVDLHAERRRVAASGGPIPAELLRGAVEATDCNAALFDATNNFAGFIPGMHEVLADKVCPKASGALTLPRRSTPASARRLPGPPMLSTPDDDEFAANIEMNGFAAERRL